MVHEEKIMVSERNVVDLGLEKYNREWGGVSRTISLWSSCSEWNRTASVR